MKNKKKNLLIVLSVFAFILNLGTSALSIEDSSKTLTKSELRQIKKAEKKAQKEAKKTSTEINKEEINKNILTPNVSPGFMNDTAKTKQYYESFEGAHRTELQGAIDSTIGIEEDLKLPARIEKDGTITKIERVEFTKSEIFSDLEIAKFKALVEGQELTAEDLNNFIKIINNQYSKKNVITARATLESLSGGVLKVELMEAKIGNITVEGNRFNRKWYLKKQISSKSEDVLNIQVLEQELKNFNKDARSIKLSAQLKPGDKYGTTDVILKAKEDFPYHFSASWDSFGRETTGLLRGGLMVSADTLFGIQDRLTGAINMARSSFNPFVDYNIPINRKGTRIGASYMYGKSKVTSGDYKDFDLNANTHVFSTYLSHPLIDNQRAQLKLNTSANIKLSTADVSGFRYTNYKDYNLAVGFGGRYNFEKGILFGSLYSTNGIIRDDMREYSKFFTKVNADGYYIHYLPKGIIFTVRGGGQYSPYSVPFVEQYQIGGISSIRGYSESLLLAENSGFVSLETLFPIPFLPQEVKLPFRENATFRMRDAVKFATFIDGGAIIPNKGKTGTTNFLASVGAGIRVAISKYLTARVYVGVPLMNAGVYNQSNARVHFDLVVSPF
jgi:hemolysin activation/secretion protein